MGSEMCIRDRLYECASARFTGSQRRYETQTRDNSRTPSSTTEYGLFRVSSDLRLGERLPPVAGFPLAWCLAPAMVAEGVACIRRSAWSLARGVGGEARLSDCRGQTQGAVHVHNRIKEVWKGGGESYLLSISAMEIINLRWVSCDARFTSLE